MVRGLFVRATDLQALSGHRKIWLDCIDVQADRDIAERAFR